MRREREYVSTRFVFVDEEEKEDWWGDDDDRIDGECLPAIGNSEYSYGEIAAGEYSAHEIHICLIEIGERWAATLQVLEAAEIIAVDMSPHFLDVAPWHARDI